MLKIEATNSVASILYFYKGRWYTLNRNPIITERRKGTVEDPYVLLNETHVVDESVVILSEIPDEHYKVIVTGEGVEWTEIYTGIPSATQFIVDYVNRIITFNSDNNGMQLNFEYQGTGVKYFPASSVYTKTENGKVIETLGEVVQKGKEAISNINEVQAVIEEAESAIVNTNDVLDTVNTKISEIDSNISMSNQKISELDNTINNADTLISNKIKEIDKEATITVTNKIIDLQSQYDVKELEWSSNIDEKMIELDTAISDASETIINVDSKMLVADQKISELQTTINNADTQIADKISDIDTRGTNAINDKMVSIDETFNANLTQWDIDVDAKISEVNSIEAEWQENENARVLAEIDRNTSEETRALNEDQRVLSESTRVERESSRQSAETERVTAETTRQQQEQQRQEDTQKAIANTVEVINSANSAITEIDEATSNVQSLIDNTKFVNPYDMTIQYKKNNIVSYNGSSFIAKQDTIGNTPVGNTEDAYWGLLAQRGIDGEGSVSSVNGLMPDTTGNVSIVANDVNAYTREETDSKIADIVDSAPETLNTLNELAKALGDDPNFATTITTEIGKKVDKVVGKQLSTEDFTTLEKTKLAGIEDGANNYIHPDTHSASMIVEDPTRRFVSDTKISEWDLKETVEGSQAKANTARDEAKTYTDSEISSLKATDVGAIPSSEKGVANGVATLNADGKVVDANGNEVEGKVTSVNGQIGDVTVETFSGDYNDLTNKPTIPDISGKADKTELHSHDNKVVLDGLSDNEGKLEYNGTQIGSVTSVNGQTGDVVLETEDEILQSPTPPEGIEEGRLWLDTSEDVYQGTVFQELQDDIGDTSLLETENKTNLVEAINEINAKEVDISGLATKTELQSLDDEVTSHLAEKASKTTLGHVRVGEGISVDENGVISVAEMTASNVSTSDGSDVQTEIDNLKQSVSDGKQVVSTSITDKGGTVEDADGDGISSYQELSNGVQSIPTPSGNVDYTKGPYIFNNAFMTGGTSPYFDSHQDTETGNKIEYRRNSTELNKLDKIIYDPFNNLISQTTIYTHTHSIDYITVSRKDYIVFFDVTNAYLFVIDDIGNLLAQSDYQLRTSTLGIVLSEEDEILSINADSSTFQIRDLNGNLISTPPLSVGTFSSAYKSRCLSLGVALVNVGGYVYSIHFNGTSWASIYVSSINATGLTGLMNLAWR